MRVGVSFLDEDDLGPYLAALRSVGLDPVPISPREARGLDGLRGLMLTGGGDVNPSLYGAGPHPLTSDVSAERDDLEWKLIEEAERRDLPTLGICRGLQVLNVARGGTLLQQVAGHDQVEHTVRPQPGSRIAGCVGPEIYTVNSRHHQAAERIGRGLMVTAFAADGTIEALEDPARGFLVAVQWHPEDRLATSDSRIFGAFAKAIR